MLSYTFPRELVENNKEQTNVRVIMPLVMCSFMMRGLRDKVIRYGQMKGDFEPTEINWTNNIVDSYY